MIKVFFSYTSVFIHPRYSGHDLLVLRIHSLSFVTPYLGVLPSGEPFSCTRVLLRVWGSIPSLSLPCTLVLLPLGNHSLSFVTLNPGFAPFAPFGIHSLTLVTGTPVFFFFCGSIHTLSLPRNPFPFTTPYKLSS